MAYRNFYSFHRKIFKKIYSCKLDENRRNFYLNRFSKIIAVFEIFDFAICLMLLLMIRVGIGPGRAGPVDR